LFDFVNSIRERDPARPTFFEVILAYPGFHAVGLHRAAQFFWKLRLRALARLISYISRMFTGIEIHPGATIGRNLFIDHGTGVVIGETSIIGHNVTMYHGVTLGGKGGRVNPGKKRHPTIGDEAILGAGAQVLGDVIVGKRAKVGANSVVTGDVPEGCSVVGIPARLVQSKQGDQGQAYGMPQHLIDPVAEAISGLIEDVKALKEKTGLSEPAQEDKDYEDAWKGSGI
jgi:serine O-acetyltransferase